MIYDEYHPTDRDDIITYVDKIKRPEKPGIDLINSGTGSGKTRIMEKICHKENGCHFLVSPNSILMGQTMKVFQSSPNKNSTCLIDIKDVGNSIQQQFRNISNIVIFVPGVAHNSGEYSKTTKKMFAIIEVMKSINIRCDVMFDEFDQQFTKIVGGAQIRVEMSNTNLELINKFLGNSKLNVCRELNKMGVHIIGLSATLNNVISTKIPLITYPRKRVRIFNIFPIESLYSKLKIESIDTSNFELLFAVRSFNF
jgi:hypothetical protein